MARNQQKQVIKKKQYLLLKKRLKKLKLKSLFSKKPKNHVKLNQQEDERIEEIDQSSQQEELQQKLQEQLQKELHEEEQESTEQQSEIIVPLNDEDFQNSEQHEEEEELEVEQENEQEDEKQIINKHHLIKNWEPIFTQPSIYTGGRIQISQNEEFIVSICNFKIMITDIKTRKITNQIEHVKYNLNDKQKNQKIKSMKKNYVILHYTHHINIQRHLQEIIQQDFQHQKRNKLFITGKLVINGLQI
ncbi:hypothetical protein IMG5_097070 [Ichthyophthirius multifiliis]|uniref:Uncharacterized protein n=1 Tax=Ichthyophthirius multifiliis TaxID=5932 RepID=G0QRQ6_ICHMU|nr:hypothetical protein IMG5_097070 [Ichthyophthirius multifiliis]EGR32093.1 hypothetical protein IMG5_097070 [Ichthyophthirius multifiliis]|eukprot:XP_004035579.1 hypothetical protein IMG5_097070 [Ichthyophthirius multifiliis]